VIDFVGLSSMCVLCEVWVGWGACVALGQNSLELGFNSPTSYFDFI